MSLETDPVNGFRPVSEDEAHSLAGGNTDADDRALPPGEDGDDRGSSRDERGIDRSKAFKKRIVRLKRGFSQQLAERDAEHQRELREMEARLTKKFSRGEENNDDDAAHEREMAILQSQLQNALDAGKAEEAARLNRAMAKKESQFWVRKETAAMGGAARSDDAAAADATRRPPPAQSNGKVTTEGQRFIEANDWFDDEDFAAERGACIGIERQLLKEGSDPNKPGHYRRLAKAVKAKFPKLDVQVQRFHDDEEDEERDEDLEDEPAPTRRTAPVGVRNRQSGSDVPRRPQRSVSLSDEDKRQMRLFKLDPDNDKDVLQWVREGQSQDRVYNARR